MSWSVKQMSMRWVSPSQTAYTVFTSHIKVTPLRQWLLCVCVQVRHYSPTRWVSTDAEAYFMGVGAAMAFRRLFQYITGANDGGEDQKISSRQEECVRFVCLKLCVCVCVSCAGIQMEMTAPVLVKIPEETKMWEPAVYTLNFPLPAAYQDKPPAPTNDKVSWTWQEGCGRRERAFGCRVRQFFREAVSLLPLPVMRSNAFIPPASASNLIIENSALRSIERVDGCTVFSGWLWSCFHWLGEIEMDWAASWCYQCCCLVSVFHL